MAAMAAMAAAGRSLVAGLAFACALASCDPVHSDAVDALGGEQPGVRTGPLHRPGQPCLLCHDGKVGDPAEFSVAGTIFQNAADTMPASGAAVILTATNGASYTATTNEAGNFYLSPNQFNPVYPMSVIVNAGGTIVRMSTVIGRSGSCATCHADPAGPSSAGHVFIPAGGVTP
jgi:hypothetical protein